MIDSDEILYLKLIESRNSKIKISKVEIFRACCVSASLGKKEVEEETLSIEHKIILQSYRELFQENYHVTIQQLSNAKFSNDLLEAYRHSLLGAALYRGLKNNNKAHENFLKSASYFKKSMYEYKYCCSLMNAHIVKCDLQSYLSGPLFYLEKVCLKKSYYDLAACISRGRGIETLLNNNYSAALSDFKRSIKLYTMADQAEERAITQYLICISLWLMNSKKNLDYFACQIRMNSPRILIYKKIFEDLLNNIKPSPPKNHPLHSFNWNLIDFAHKANWTEKRHYSFYCIGKTNTFFKFFYFDYFFLNVFRCYRFVGAYYIY
jgi:hypothetical protein